MKSSHILTHTSMHTLETVRIETSFPLRTKVGEGDIWRMCQTKDVAIKDWVRLAVQRARLTGSPTMFWLDSERAHDAVLITKVEKYLKDHDTSGLELSIMAPAAAMTASCEHVRKGTDVISATGNVLRYHA